MIGKLNRENTIKGNNSGICGQTIENRSIENKELTNEIFLFAIKDIKKRILKQYEEGCDGNNLIKMLVNNGVEVDGKNHPEYNPEDKRDVENQRNVFGLSDLKEARPKNIQNLAKFAELLAIELFNDFFEDCYTAIKTNELDDYTNNCDLFLCSLKAKFPTLGIDITITDYETIFQKKYDKSIRLNSNGLNIKYGTAYRNNRYLKEKILKTPWFCLRIKRELLEKYFKTTDVDNKKSIKKEMFLGFCQDIVDQYEKLKNKEIRLKDKCQELNEEYELTKNECAFKELEGCKKKLSYLKKILEKTELFIDYIKGIKGEIESV